MSRPQRHHAGFSVRTHDPEYVEGVEPVADVSPVDVEDVAGELYRSGIAVRTLGLALTRGVRLPWPMALFRAFLGLLVLCAAAALAPPRAAAQSPDSCDAGQIEWGAPGLANAISHYSLEWTPFGATEWGWETYLPLIQ